MDFRANEMRKRNDPSLIIGHGLGNSIDLDHLDGQQS